MLFRMCSLQLPLYPGFLFLVGGGEEGEFKMQIYAEDLKWNSRRKGRMYLLWSLQRRDDFSPIWQGTAVNVETVCVEER